MFAIIEGTDGTGKSSLAEAVAAEILKRHPDDKVDVHHKGPPAKPVLEEYVLDYESYRPGTGRHIVADRHHLGTLVYAQIYRDTGPFGELGVAGFRWAELVLMARGVRSWIADLPLDDVVKRLNVRGEDYLQPEHVAQVLNRFREVGELSASFVKFVEPDGYTGDIVDSIVDHAERMERETANLAQWPSYIGLHRPTVLLVGEKRQGDGPHPSEACFMPDGPNRSGHFLLESLPEDFWKGVGIVNAYETEDFESLLDVLHPPQIVALGRSASDFLLDLNLNHAAVPHPSFVKRFHRKKQAEYGDLIKDVSQTGEVHLSWPK